MTTLYYHPLASYCWKVLIALYELGTPFEKRVIDLGDPAQRAELAALWPLCKFPVLKVDGRVVAESSIIVEYLALHHAESPGALLPRDATAALDVRLWDRLIDNYVHSPMQELVSNRLQGGSRDEGRARSTLAAAYDLLEQQLASRTWVVGSEFSAADCAAAPALFYALTLEPLPSRCSRLRDYFERLVERPSVKRTLDEAKPYFASYPFERDIPARFR
jgi:glutathione S-transferase